MTAKTYLDQLKNIDKRINDKIMEAQKWREIAQNPSAHISEVKVQKTILPDRLGDAISKAVTYEQESEDLASELTELKHTIIRQIDEIGDEKYYNLLKGYYIKRMTYTELGKQEKLSYKQAKRQVQLAIDSFDEKYGETFKDKQPILVTYDGLFEE